MGDNSKHAILSPSGAHRWMRCPGSVAACAGLKNDDTDYSKEGTAAHELAAICLTHGGQAHGYVGRKMSNGCEVTESTASDVQSYVDYVLSTAKNIGGVLLVEESLDIGFITGEEGAKGTADAVILAPDLIVIIDLKFGRGVEVNAQDNEQLLMYAAAAHHEYSSYTDTYSEVCAIIHQPRLSSISEANYTVDDLRAFIAAARGIAHDINAGNRYLEPGEKQCRWCLAKADCSALRDFVAEETRIDFEDLTAELPVPGEAISLSQKMQSVPLIEMWCKAVKDAVNDSLRSGNKVPGFKLIRGKAGNRSWEDAAAAEKAMLEMRLKKVMYKRELISPTAAEKLVKSGDIGDRQWKKLQGHITRADGALKVVPESDKGEEVAVEKADDMFNDVSID